MRYLFPVLTLVAVLSAGSAVATEEPSFSVRQTLGENIEVRTYAPLIVAETSVTEGRFKQAGNDGFRVLADYIFGNNQGSRKIAMTAPVEQRSSSKTEIAMTAPVEQSARADGGWVVSFTMPSEWTLATLPLPVDPRVSIREVPARDVAVIRFSGTWSDKRFAEKNGELLDAVAAAKLETKGEPWNARYDPPWTPWFMRRNEILVEVASP